MTEPVSGTISKLAERYDVHRNTMCKWANEPGAPAPFRESPRRWLFSDWDDYFKRLARAGQQSRTQSGCNRS